MKPNQWIESRVDTELYLQLQDLTTVLSRQSDFTFVYNYGSYIDIIDKKVTGSSYWDTDKHATKFSGYKTDLFLRMIGSLKHTNLEPLHTFLRNMNGSALHKFSLQLITLLEDLRLEALIIKERPGTKKDFYIRNAFLRRYFETQVAANSMKGYTLDELFCLIYLTVQAKQPEPNFPKASHKQLKNITHIQPLIHTAFEANTTKDVVAIAQEIIVYLDEYKTDMINTYFSFPIYPLEACKEATLFDELTRTDPLANDDYENVDEKNNAYIDERFSTWHRENENDARKQTFLQFDLDVGTKTTIRGGTTRETAEGDQSIGTMQGTSTKTEMNDYAPLEALEKKENQSASTDKEIHERHTANHNAVAIYKDAHAPTVDDIQTYNSYLPFIVAYQKKLKATIDKTLEHKKNEHRKQLVHGRLSKQLLPFVIDRTPNVFYKKANFSKDINAAFTLLVDCSASMHNKMEQTKKAIILFHEVLKQLKVAHSIVGFWEDALNVKKDVYPNYFHIIRKHDDSFYPQDGAKIMQLEPQEDNRDGFSIRIATKSLTERREKNKFLLIFSDGEPAAADYDQMGVVDTNIAVKEARKKGIHVIGIFLAESEITERENLLMKNIYGKKYLIVPTVSELADHFAPLLKRLLLQTIQ